MSDSTSESDRMYDAIVVGAGPAGTAAATPLAKSVTRVLVLEAPRYKACAGAVSGRAAKFLTVDFAGCRR